MTNSIAVTLLVVFFCPVTVWTQPRVLDDFDTLSGWTAIPSQGASLSLSSAEGKVGKALEMDFNLTGVYGYVIAQKQFDLDLPENYRFTFDMRAEAPANNFEFKLLDSLGNVFWIKKLNITYPTTWTRQKIAKRHISYAWGPSGKGEIHHVAKIEFVVSTGTGGRGKVVIDNFRLEPIDDAAVRNATAGIKVSSAKNNRAPATNRHGTELSEWITDPQEEQSLLVDFNCIRELGGIVIDWDSVDYATAYDVELSDDGKEWSTEYSVTQANGGRDYLYLPDREGREMRLNLHRSVRRKGYHLRSMSVKGPAFSTQPNDFFSSIAQESRKGLYPKYFLKQQSGWTVVGSPGDPKEALINEQGMIEVDKLSFSIEPFLYIDNKLVTWHDVGLTRSLEEDYLPIPSVQWTYGNWKLTVTAFSAGGAGNSLLTITYAIENAGGGPAGKLFLAIRPFQVNPPWQSLNTVGGVSHIDSIGMAGGRILVDGKSVLPLTHPAAFGATTFDRGDIVEYLSNGSVPSATSIHDPRGFGSAAIEYDFSVYSGNRAEFYVAVPFERWKGTPTPDMSDGGGMYITLARDATEQLWRSTLNKVRMTLPSGGRAVANTIRSNLAYIFINRDGAGIQPGSRSYERSWIRDGALTSAALLQMGQREEVRQFIDWYATFQFPNGAIPCVVDARGGDPTAEHDSHGEFIYAILNYFNFTHDTTWLRGKYDAVVKTVRFIDSLRSERKTDLYRTGTDEQRACYGLVPESISHEGYSDHPRHSYWDDFFILKGLKDATTIAGILGEQDAMKRFGEDRDDFRHDLYASMRLTMANKHIDYIPGCVELGDFDATSTTIGVDPCGELGNIPEPELHHTFDTYYRYFSDRRNNTIEWTTYTPYETRIIGTFVYLDEKQRAKEALDFFMKDRRPDGWNQWAEVVHRDPSTPRFIGDMPHTWVGSDFIRSVRAMFVYERDRDTSLVVAAGVPDAWVLDSAGVSIGGFPTYYGTLSYSITSKKNHVTVTLSGTMTMPPGGIVVKSPLSRRPRSIHSGNARLHLSATNDVRIRKIPATVEFAY